jgi:hypothetical protein
MRLAHEQHQLQRILAKLEAMEGNLDKLEAPRGIVGFVIRNRFCAAISAVLIAKVLFGTTDRATGSHSSAQEKKRSLTK